MAKVAIVLSAGGTRAAFEVGAVKCLYSKGIKPDLLCSSSGGSFNAIKLAEGTAPHDPDRGLAGLEKLWLGLKSNDDMYRETDWVIKARKEKKELWDNLLETVLKDIAELIVHPAWGVKTIMDQIGGAEKLFGEAGKQKSIFTLEPMRGLLAKSYRDDLVRNSGINLIVSNVSLETGLTMYVDNRGQILDGKLNLMYKDEHNIVLEDKVALIDAVMASGSIPVVFPPVKLNSNNCVDGGLRKFIPVEAAVLFAKNAVARSESKIKDWEVPKIYAISVYANEYPQDSSYDSKNALDILNRITDIMSSEIQSADLYPYLGWGVDLTVIGPRLIMPQYSSMTVDPGTIRIGMDYGFMRAADVMSGANEALCKSTDKIIDARFQAWELEQFFDGPMTIFESVASGGMVTTTGFGQRGVDALKELRKLKTQIAGYISERVSYGGEFPPGVDVGGWVQNYEAHVFNRAGNPWESMSFDEVITATDVDAKATVTQTSYPVRL